MLDESQKKNIKLSDVIDLKFLQELQDNFAKTLGVASIIFDSDGYITKPSNFSASCSKYIHVSPIGSKKCSDCTKKWEKIASEKGEPVIYSCNCGLTDFIVPIILNGSHVASIAGGQVLTNFPDEEHARKIAREFELNEDGYVEAIRSVRIIPYKQVELASKMLYTIANSISKLAHQNYELIKKNERDYLLRKTIEVIRSKFNAEEIKNYFVEIIRNYFDADRCFFVDYDKKTDKILPIRVEKLKSPKIKSLVGADVEKDVPEFSFRQKKGKNIIIKDVEKTLSRIKSNNNKSLEKTHQDDTKSDYGLPVKYKDELLGGLVIHFIDKKKVLTQDEYDFLKALGDQVGIALYQNWLYEKERKTAERETILRRIIEATRSSYDIKTVKQNIVNQLGQSFDADRCYFRAYDRIQDKFFPPDVEYLSSPSIKSLLDVEPNQEGLKYFSNELRARSKGFYPVVASAEFVKNTPLEKYMKVSEIEADYAMPIIDDEEGFTWLVLHYVNEDPKFDDDYKKLLETITFHVDTSLKQMKLYNRAKKQIEREKAILNNLPFIAWLKDDESRYLNVNEPYAKFCGRKVEEMIGKNDCDVQPEELAEKYRKDDIKVMETGKQISTEEQIASADGTYKWYETFKTPVFDENNNVVGTAGFARDITEQKEVERMKNEFVSIVSHELRTPLTSIRGALGLISSYSPDTLPEKVNSLLNIASNNTIRLINLINDILDLEKIKAGKMDFSYGEYEVTPLIKETIKLNEEYARQYNVKYVIKNKLDNALINVDKSRFIQVLTNLLSNASKFSYQNEEVHICVERKKNLISVSVTNKGSGIPEKFFSKIFQQFSQVDSSDKRKSGGTGLGLSICKSIIEKMGGTIGFNSKVDEYTTFYFELPEIIKNRNNKTVLICDDNKTTAFCIKAMFEKLDYNVDIALTASEAMQLLDTKTFDLMTLDFLLPDKESLFLFDEFKNNEKTKDLPVLIISVKKPDLELIRKNHQVIDWLENSLDIADLEKTINKILRKKNQHKIDILHVENDKDILSLIELTLGDIANITQAKSLVHAESIIKESMFDMIILDYVFPDGTSDKLIPSIKSGPNKDAKLILFSSYEESKILARYVDSIILKTNVSNEQFKESIKKIIGIKDESEIKG